MAGRNTESELPGSPRHQDVTKGLKYHLHGQDLKTTETMKYLGVTISHETVRLGDTHITNVTVTNKANQTFGFLRRNLKIGSVTIKERAYKALVESDQP